MDNLKNYLRNMDENKKLSSNEFGKFFQKAIFKFTIFELIKSLAPYNKTAL